MADENDKDDKDAGGKETASLKKRLDKHQGDAMALAAELSAEVADLNRQLAAAKGQKPKEGSLLLTPEQAKQWEALIALGKSEEVVAAYQSYAELGKIEDLKAKLTEHAALTTENATLKKSEQLRKVADVGIGDKKLNLAMLTLLDQQAGGLTFEERDISVTKDGKTTTEKVMSVKDGNKWVPLSEHYETHWKKDFGSALITDSQPVPSGTRVAGGGASDKSTSTNIYADIRKAAEEKQKQQQVIAVPLEKRLNMV